LTIITDRDSIIAVAGATKKDYVDKAVGDVVEKSMESRKTIFVQEAGEVNIVQDGRESYSSYAIAPIISSGDPIGSVILINKGTEPMNSLEVKMVETAASFLAKQMEQ